MKVRVLPGALASLAQWKSSGLLSRWFQVRVLGGALGSNRGTGSGVPPCLDDHRRERRCC